MKPNEVKLLAEKFFKNKFVFYSPSITFGIDFSIEEAQDVFIYITGRSINSESIFLDFSTNFSSTTMLIASIAVIVSSPKP